MESKNCSIPAPELIIWMNMILYMTQVVISVTGSVGSLIYIVKFINKGLNLSRGAMKLQKMLIMSLFMQGGIHSIFIITPTIFQIYAIFFELHANEFAQFLLLCVAYHGFFSTCAMIIFTKPLKDKLIFWLRCNNRTRDESIQQSSNRLSAAVTV